jgi:uncharacterized protein (DUF2141 family)
LTAGKIAWATLAGTLALLAGAAQGQECEGKPGEARLSIVVEGVRSSHGLMTATLYPDDKSRFLVRNGSLKVWRDRAHAPVTDMCIWLPEPGAYAVAIYHDANANMKFDIGPLGPTEAYGFSNNPRILFSKPSFESVRFVAHAGENVIHVKLHNPA